MTTQNYTNDQTRWNVDIIRFVMKSNPNYYRFQLKREYPMVYHFIETKNPLIQDYNFQTKLYWVLNGLSDFPRCSTCGRKLTKPIVKLCKGYPKTCCIKCSNENESKKQMIRKTTIRHWGGIGFASKELNDKERQIFLEKYGSEDPGNMPKAREKAKQTSIQNWGVDNPMKSSEVKDNLKKSMVEKYGVEFYSQTSEYHKNKKHRFESQKYPGCFFDSTWEVKVYEFCRDSGLEVEYSPNISFDYEYDGHSFTYHPDFLINGNLYEVKGNQFFKVNDLGQEEMVYPYKRPEWTDDDYKWWCEKAQMKYKCMQDNGVILIRGKDMDNLNEIFIVNTNI